MKHNNDHTITPKPGHAIRLSAQGFALWGSEHLAYVKPVKIRNENGHSSEQTAYGIHRADGQPVGMAETRDLAIAAVIREGWEPLSVH